MADARKLDAGDPVPGTGFWRWLIGRARASALKPEPPLVMSRSGASTTLAYKPDPEMDAIVVGASAYLYAMREAWFQGGAFVPMPGGRTVGAYPYNPADSLEVGAPARLHFTRAGDWRFQVIRDGGDAGSPSPPPPAPCKAFVRVIIEPTYFEGNTMWQLGVPNTIVVTLDGHVYQIYSSAQYVTLEFFCTVPAPIIGVTFTGLYTGAPHGVYAERTLTATTSLPCVCGTSTTLTFDPAQDIFEGGP